MRSGRHVFLRCLLSAVMALSAPLAAAGPFDAWAYRTRIGLNNAVGTETLFDFPLLVTLNAANFDFGRAKADGSDLRFATAGGAVLSYEIEKWDAAAGAAAVWVKVPQIDLGSTAGFINMYVGNAAAVDAQNAADVWSNGYVGVWHLGASLNDSTLFANHGTSSGTVTLASGMAGDARSFNTGSVSTPAVSNGSLDAGNNVSITYWMKGAAADQPGAYTRVMGKNSDAVPGWEYQRNNTGSNNDVRIDTSAANNQVRGNATGAFDGNWHFVGTTLGDGAVRGYLDGGTPSSSTYSVGGGFGNSLPLTIGARVGGGNAFRGLIDEVRVSNVVRTAGWMNAEYRSQAGQMAVLGPMQFVSGLVAEYSHEDAGNRTLDTSGNGHDATAVNGVTFVAPSSPGGFAAGLGDTVASFSRPASQYLNLPAGLATDLGTSFTFTALVRGDGLVAGSGHQTILSSNRFRFQRGNADQLLLQVTRPPDPPNTSNQLVQMAANTFAPDAWYMAVLRYDTATNRADAYLIPATSLVTSPGLTLTPTVPMTDITSFRIGADGLSAIGGFDGWNGQIDNSRFFSGALSKRQLRDVFYSYTGHVGPVGLVAQYAHENAANRLADDTGHGLTLTNQGVDFVAAAPTNPGGFDAGATVGQYVRAQNDYLNAPELYTDGDDFTFVALVRRDSLDVAAHQTILASDNFRFQYQGTSAGAGRLRLDYRDAGSTLRNATGAADAFPIEHWQLVAMTYNAATDSLQAYLQPDSPVFFGPSFSVTGNGIDVLETMRRFRIGSDGVSAIGLADAFGGWIDGVRFYDQAFTRAQLREIFREYRPSAPGPIGLLAHYTHDSANPLADDTGHLATLTNRGGTTFVPSAPTNPGPFEVGATVGQYTRLSTDGLDVPAIYVPGDDFTFVALVRKNSDETAGHQTILSSNRFRYQFRNTGTTDDGAGTLRLELNAGGGTTESGDNTFRTGEWYFTAFTYDAATGQIRNYLQDGSPVFRGPVGSLTANLNDMTRFQIGNNGLSGIGGADPFGGWIDGARFYDQALTTLQLRDLFRTLTGNAPGPIGLVARYDHENAANRLEDTSGNALHATNGGTVTFAAPVSPGPFQLGGTAGQYDGAATSYVDLPGVHTPGDDFTFTAMVRKQGGSAGHQTLLASDRFRFQYRSTDGANGALRLDLNSTAGGGTWETPLGSFPADTSEFVVLQYNAATGQITTWLQDGSPVFLGPEYTATTTNRAYFDAISRFRLGGDGLSGIAGAGFDAFRGQMDGVRFYDTLLSKRELRDVFREYNPLPAGAVGLVAQYTHESANPLADDTGHGVTATNRGLVTFTAPPPGGIFGPGLGSLVGLYPRQDDGALDFPQFYTAGDDFTFTALVRKNSDETGGHQTILSSNRFRLQFQNTGTTDDGAGQLYLQVNGAGSTGPTGSGTGTFETDEWYFVALRYSASSHVLEAFLDNAGGLDGPIISQSVAGPMGLDDMLNFRVGADGLSLLGDPDPFGGWIDRVQFYDRFLSDGELQQAFAAAVPEPAAIALLLLGLGALPLARRWRRRRAVH